MIKFSREGNDNPCGYDIGHIEISNKNIIISSHQPLRSFMVYVSAIELLYFLRLNMLDADVEKVFHFTSSNFYLTFKFSHNEMSAIDNKTNSKVIQEKWLYMQEFVSATAKR